MDSVTLSALAVVTDVFTCTGFPFTAAPATRKHVRSRQGRGRSGVMQGWNN